MYVMHKQSADSCMELNGLYEVSQNQSSTTPWTREKDLGLQLCQQYEVVPQYKKKEYPEARW